METFLDRIRKEGILLGREEGLAEGQQSALANVTTLQLREKFGRLEQATKTHIQALSFTELTRLAKALLQFEAPADLDKWLRRHPVSAQTQTAHTTH